MSKAVYSYDHVFAAMCIMEEIASPSLNVEPWQDLREERGINELRGVVIDHLAGPCNAAWERAYKRYEEATTQYEFDKSFAEQASGNLPEPPKDPGSFDYEFVPFWLAQCVDWEAYPPRVKGSAT